MEYRLKVKAGEGNKRNEITLDDKTTRRMLEFVNSARRPEDLLTPPDIRAHLHVEYRKRAFPERHPDPQTTRETLCNLDLARSTFEKCREQPVQGITRIAHLFEIRDIVPFLELLWSHLSRAARGSWDGPYDIPDTGHDRPVHAAMLRTGKVLFFGLPQDEDFDRVEVVTAHTIEEETRTTQHSW